MLESFLRGTKQLGIAITPEQARQFQLYYEELKEWNQRVNLTAITEYEEVQIKHFLDSVTVIPILEKASWAKADFSFVDVGTGGGIPGIPLKIVLKQARALLLDSVAKKTAFVQHVVQRLALEGTEVVTGRAEVLAHQAAYREIFNLAVCRAVSQLAAIAELTLPFVQIGGLAVIFKKTSTEQELEGAANAIGIVGGRIRETRDLDLEGLEQHRLIVLEKVAPTPYRYPRRAGIPEKRPLL